MLWIYLAGYTAYVVGIYCGIPYLCCGYILWDTVPMLWVYIVGYPTYVVGISCGVLDIPRGYSTTYVYVHVQNKYRLNTK